MIRKLIVIAIIATQLGTLTATSNGFFNDDCCNNKCRWGWYSSCRSCTRNINPGEAQYGSDTCCR